MKIGIDLGGTKTEGILIDDSGKEISRTRIKTEKNYDGTINGIISIVKKFENDFGNSKSVLKGFPFNHIELAFFTKAESAETAPGIPIPTDVELPKSFSNFLTIDIIP